MHRALAVAFLGIALIIAGMVRADAASPGVKIGFVDLERTLYETNAGKSASAAFERTRKAKQGEFDKKQKELQRLAAQLEKQALVLKPEAVARQKADLEKKFSELMQLQAKLERDLASERAKLIEGILKKAAPVIEDIAKKQGYVMIVDRQAVLWAPDALDITPEVNKRVK